MRGRSGWVVVAAAAAGLAAAAVTSLVQPTRYRAETTVVLLRGTQPLAGGAATRGLVSTFRELAQSDIVAAGVIQNLALHESSSSLLDHVSVTSDGGSAILRLRVDDGDRRRAKQLTQELALVFTQLVRDRFGSAGGSGSIAIAVFDPAHVLPGKISPRVWRNLGYGVVIGALVGAVAVSLRRREL